MPHGEQGIRTSPCGGRCFGRPGNRNRRAKIVSATAEGATIFRRAEPLRGKRNRPPLAGLSGTGISGLKGTSPQGVVGTGSLIPAAVVRTLGRGPAIRDKSGCDSSNCRLRTRLRTL
jgi:predicted alpha/beta hydrolase